MYQTSIMPKKTCFFLLWCCAINYGQHTISGTIIGANSQPLEGCHIHIGSKSSESTKNGSYSISKVQKGNAKVYVTALGYTGIDTIIQVDSNKKLDFVLKQKTQQLNEVFVKHKDNYYNHSVLENKIKEKTIDQFSNQSLGNLLSQISGVSVLKTGSTIVKPVINGLHSSRVPIFSNNVRLEDQQWGIDHAPNFDVNAAGKITVIKGASGLQYGGDAIGGIVIIEPIQVAFDTLFGKAITTLESNGRGGTISSSLHKGNFCDWSWNAQGSFKYLGDRESAYYSLTNSGNREANFSGDIKYTGKKYDFTAFYSLYNATIGILSASHIGSATDLFYAIDKKEPFIVRDFSYNINNPKQKVQHHLAKLNYTYRIKEGKSLALQYAFQFNNRKEFDVRRSIRSSIPALDLDLVTHTINADYKWSNDNTDIKSGVIGAFQNNAANPDTGIRPLIPSYNKWDTGIYGIVDHHFSEHFSIEAGVRYDFSKIVANKFYLKSRWDERGFSPKFDSFIIGDFETQWLTEPNFTFHNVSASIGVQYSFEKSYEWYFNFSRALRNPNPSEFFSDGLHHATGQIEFGELGLQSEKSNKMNMTLQKKGKVFGFTVYSFLNYIENFIFLTPNGFETTIRGAFPTWEYRQTDALLAGIDVDSEWKINQHVTQQFRLSYVRGRDVSKDDYLIEIPPLRFHTKLQFAKKEWNELLVEIQCESVFRQTKFPNTNFTTNIVINENLVPVEVDISTPPPGYQLFHLYSEIKFKTLKKTTATLAFSVFNILNINYRDYLNRQRFYVDELGRNFQLQLKINY
jgi:iron complex outermembrane recepter protein